MFDGCDEEHVQSGFTALNQWEFQRVSQKAPAIGRGKDFGIGNGLQENDRFQKRSPDDAKDGLQVRRVV